MHAEKRHSFKGVSAWIQGQQLAGVSRMANKGPVMLGTTTNARQHTPVVNQQRQQGVSASNVCQPVGVHETGVTLYRCQA